MLWPCSAAIGSAQITTSTRDLFAILTARCSERECVFFGDHDHGRPTRRYLRGIGQGLLSSRGQGARLKRCHGRKMNLRNPIELRLTLWRLQDLCGNDLGFPSEIRDRHWYVLFLIDLFESYGVLGLWISHNQFYSLHAKCPLWFEFNEF